LKRDRREQLGWKRKGTCSSTGKEKTRHKGGKTVIVAGRSKHQVRRFETLSGSKKLAEGKGEESCEKGREAGKTPKEGGKRGNFWGGKDRTKTQSEGERKIKKNAFERPEEGEGS